VDAPTSKLTISPKITSLTTGVKSISAKGSAVAAKAAQKAGAVERSQRRENLRAKGALLSQMQPSMSRSEAGTPKKVESSLRKIMSQLNFKPGDSISYKVQAAPTSAAMMPKSAMAKGITKAVAAKKQSTTAYHVMFGVSAGAGTGAKGVAKGAAKKGMAKGFAAKAAAVAKGGGQKRKKSPLRKFVVLEAKEVDGKIVSVTEAHSK
jgi:hypothetical protein